MGDMANDDAICSGPSFFTVLTASSSFFFSILHFHDEDNSICFLGVSSSSFFLTSFLLP